MIGELLPSPSTLITNFPPGKTKLSTALSFVAAHVIPGRTNVAWLTHDASIALSASPFFADTTQSDPTTLPTACIFFK